MEKRALLAVLLSLLVIIIYQYFFMPEMPIKQPFQKDTEKELIEQEPFFPEFTDREEDNKKVKPEQDILDLFEQQKETKPREIIIDTEKYHAVINTKGAILSHWKLKNYYLTEKHETSPWKMNFWKMVGKSYITYFARLFGGEKPISERKEIDLFASIEANSGQGLRLIAGNKPNEGADLYSGVFETEANDVYLDKEHPEETIKLKYLTRNGFQIEKVFTFYNENYQVDTQIVTQNISNTKLLSNYSLLLGPGLGNAFQTGAHKFQGPITWKDGKKIKDKPKKKIPFIRHEENVSWTAMTSNYFFAAIIPREKNSGVFIHRAPSEVEDAISINRSTTIGIYYPPEMLDPGGTRRDFYGCYFGPKRYQTVKILGINLEQVIDYGFFSFLAKPLIYTLNVFYKFIPNYGIAIILLTIIIKIIFWPLTDKSFRSMKDMQEVQPKMASLRKKYKDDPKKLNEEVMGLYKKHGVNPMGGCLPLVLQIPVFFALYEGLMVAIEMRGAPFIFWIKDLSIMDPLLITPILMGVTMYIQQKMTPMAGDAAQMKMMTFLPLIFTVFFLGFPSGLVIYWLLNNVLTIGQHYWIMKKMKA